MREAPHAEATIRRRVPSAISSLALCVDDTLRVCVDPRTTPYTPAPMTTLADIEADLPWGLHDAYLEAIELDWPKRRQP